MRTFSEPEVAEIIARAAERQRAADQDAPSAAGLTLDEIEQVGRASGIDPAHLRAAAREVAAGPPRGGADGGVAVVERWADAPLTDAGWEDAVAHLRASPGPLGTSTDDEEERVERLGGSFEWTRTSTLLDVPTRVNVSPRGDRTRVRITQPSVISASESSFVYALIGGLVGGLVGWFLLGADGWALAASVVGPALAVYLASLPSARKSVREYDRQERARLGALADALVELVEAAAQTGAAPLPTGRDAEGPGPLGVPDAGEEPERRPGFRERARS